MRGRIQSNPSFIAVVDLDARIRPNHPLRKIKEICDKALQGLNSEFDQAYKVGGRPSIPPEQLLKGSLLQIIYGIRSERQLCERIEDSLTFRWFLDLPLDQEAWVPTVYTHNRDRLLSTEMSRNFLARVVEQAREKGFVSNDHFSVDGTLLQAWASTKSLQPMASDSDDDTPTAPPPSEPSSEPSSDDAKPRTGKDILRDFRERHSQIPLIDQAQTRILALLVRAAIQPPSPATWATR
ncbi:MAG: transposase [Fibrobacteres bacterium]|nr:transposase [Fibrobacterota bacterium]